MNHMNINYLGLYVTSLLLMTMPCFSVSNVTNLDQLHLNTQTSPRSAPLLSFPGGSVYWCALNASLINLAELDVPI